MRSSRPSWLLSGLLAAACLIPGVEIDSSQSAAGGSGGTAGSPEAAAGGEVAGGAATSGAATGGAATGGAAMGGVDSEAGSGGEDGAAGAGVVCDAEPWLPVSAAEGRSTAPSVAWTGDGYGVAWQDDRDGNEEIYFARLDSDGNKLGDDVRVTQDAAASTAPVLVWSSSEFGLVWADGRDGNNEIYFARLGPNGTKLGAEVRVTMDAARSEFPSLVGVAPGYAVAWNDTRDTSFQIYAARLDGAGAKLGAETRVSGNTPLAASPALAAAGDGLGVAWIDTRDGAGLQIYFARLDSSGARIGDELLLSELELGGGGASVAANGTGFAIAWGTPGSGGGEIYWVSVDADGNVEGSPVPLSASQNTAAFPVLITSGDGHAIAWPDGRDGDREIYVQELDASGGKLGEPVPVSDDATASLTPSLTKSSVGYGVAWIDDPTETTGEVHFANVCR